MITIKGTEIHLTKGDTAYLNIEVENNEGVPYSIKAGDRIIMTVRNYLSDALAFTKEVSADNCIVINPADTSSLSVGRYKYDVQLTTAIGEVFTIIPKSFLCLEEEVTHG